MIVPWYTYAVLRYTYDKSLERDNLFHLAVTTNITQTYTKTFGYYPHSTQALHSFLVSLFSGKTGGLK